MKIKAMILIFLMMGCNAMGDRDCKKCGVEYSGSPRYHKERECETVDITIEINLPEEG